MPTTPLPERLRELLARPNPAVMATTRADGQPVSVATWYLVDGDRVLLNLDAGRVRLAHLRRDPRVALTVLDENSWYVHVSLQLRVVEIADDPDLAGIDRLSTHYTGRPYPNRDNPRVSAWLDVERWHGWQGGTAVED